VSAINIRRGQPDLEISHVGQAGSPFAVARPCWLLAGVLALILALAGGAWGGGFGRVIYVSHYEDGLLIHTGEGDLAVDFLSPSIVRIRDPIHSFPGELVPPLAAPIQRTATEFEALDPRFETIATEFLRVEIEREPLRITVRDIQGNLLLGDDPDGGIGLFEDGVLVWTARYTPEGPLRGFGRLGEIYPGPKTEIAFDDPERGSGATLEKWLAPSPAGRLNERAGVAFSVVGDARLEFPEPGKLRFTNGGPLEACVFLAPDSAAFCGSMADIAGPPPFLPRWLFGQGWRVDRYEAFGKIRDMPERLRENDLPADWLYFTSTRPEAAGWNAPMGAMAFNASLWPNPRSALEELRSKGVEAVFEAPALFRDGGLVAPTGTHGSAQSAQETIDKALRKREAVLARSDYPFDYGDPSLAGEWSRRFGTIREAGLSCWAVARDQSPTTSALRAATGLREGAARGRIRARHWRRWLESGQREAPRRSFVLDASATADMARSGHLPLPWRVDPKTDRPSQAFRVAAAAADSGLTFWGLELPAQLSAYPSPLAFRRWLQAALWAPAVLFRSATPDQAPLEGAPPEIVGDMARLWAVRSRLRPLVYSLARECALRGEPLCRPVPGSKEPDSGETEPGAALLVGPDILAVAVDAGRAGLARVNLPPGLWISLSDDRRAEGGRPLDLSLPPGGVEAFARAGTVIPYRGLVDRSEISYLVARIYPSKAGEGLFYEDAGEGLAYASGEFCVTRFAWALRPDRNTWSVTVAGPTGGYVGGRGDYAKEIGPRDLILQIYADRPPRTVAIDGAIVPRRPIVTGPSRLLGAEAPLQFHSASLPPGAAWDYDGKSFLYVWLPEREGATAVDVYLSPLPGPYGPLGI
jgi:hypothetical protein